LHRRAQRLWPELKGKLYDECWIGFRPATATGTPAIGQVPDTNVWLAYGHYRNGILLAPVTARKIAASITASLGRG
jgi:glycine/D-amino acid oxidase-like deaminating enzyme